MSSHPYVTQQNTPLADDTTLMSTTDLQSYITHANDTFVQVSGFTLQELQGQPHNMVRHPDMPKSGVCGYVVHPEKRGALERHREKSPQKWRPLLGAGQCGTDGARGKNQWLYVDSYPGDG